MIKDIEELNPKLNAHPFSDQRVLRHREVRVVKTRSGNRVAAQISEARYRQKDGRIKPAFDAADDLYRACDIRSKRVR